MAFCVLVNVKLGVTERYPSGMALVIRTSNGKFLTVYSLRMSLEFVIGDFEEKQKMFGGDYISKLTGVCYCGAVLYEISHKPLQILNCRCRAGQKMSA